MKMRPGGWIFWVLRGELLFGRDFLLFPVHFLTKRTCIWTEVRGGLLYGGNGHVEVPVGGAIEANVEPVGVDLRAVGDLGMRGCGAVPLGGVGDPVQKPAGWILGPLTLTRFNGGNIDGSQDR